MGKKERRRRKHQESHEDAPAEWERQEQKTGEKEAEVRNNRGLHKGFHLNHLRCAWSHSRSSGQKRRWTK